MKAAQRVAAVIRPKQPYLDWINRFHAPEEPVGAEQVARAGSVILAPAFARDEEREDCLRGACEEIFQAELESWLVDKRNWPQPRDYALFCQWFEVEWHYMVYDAGPEDGP